MNWIDLLIIAVCLFALVKGMNKGFVSALVFALGLAIGYMLVRWAGTTAALRISQSTSIPYGVSVVGAYVIIFSLSCWGTAFLARPVISSMQASPLSLLNKLLGAFFSIVLSLLFFSISFNLIDSLLPRYAPEVPAPQTDIETAPPSRSDARDRSKLYDPVKHLIRSLPDLTDLTTWQDKQLKDAQSE